MPRPKLKVAWIPDRKARIAAYQQRMQGLIKKVEELTILSDTRACLTFHNRDDDTKVAWPSQEEADSLIELYKALPDNQRNMKAEDQESYIKTNTQKIEKKLDRSDKVITELEMEHLILNLGNGGKLNDLSQIETENLLSYVSKKITDRARVLGLEDPYTSVNKPLGDEIPKASDVAPECGPCFRPMGRRGSVYLMDEWFSDFPHIQKHGDGAHMAARFDLNMEPSDEAEDMDQTCQGETRKSRGGEDADEAEDIAYF